MKDLLKYLNNERPLGKYKRKRYGNLSLILAFSLGLIPLSQTLIKINNLNVYASEGPSSNTIIDNPKDYSNNPIMPDLSNLSDKSDADKDFFIKYAARSYPKFTWTIVDCQKSKDEKGEFISAKAYSNESLDVHMTIYDRQGTITDSFKEDVIDRRNTFNRWRKLYMEELKEKVDGLGEDNEVYVDISYDYFKENIEVAKLDSPFDPNDVAIKEAMEVSFAYGILDPDKVAAKAAKYLQEIDSLGYKADEYYVRVFPVDKATKDVYINWFIIPPSLIASPNLEDEIRKALLNPSSSMNLVKPSSKNGLLFDKMN